MKRLTCHDVTQRLMSLNDVVMVTVGRNDSGIHIWIMAKSQAVTKMKITDRSDKSRQFKKKIKMWYYSDDE